MPPVSSPGSSAPFRRREVVAIVNTADDDEFHGLHVSPDLDSVTYTLAGASNVAQGWGLEGETFATLDALERYDGRHVVPPRRQGPRDPPLPHRAAARRRAALRGDRARSPRAWGLEVPPAPDDRRPGAHPHHGAREPRAPEELAMQEWFVRERAEPPVVSGVRFDGADRRPARAGRARSAARPPTRSSSARRTR